MKKESTKATNKTMMTTIETTKQWKQGDAELKTTANLTTMVVTYLVEGGSC